MYIFYTDESGLEKESEYVYFSAIGVRHTEWKQFFYFLKNFRIKMAEEHGFYRHKEWHASKFIGGRGKLGRGDIYKSTRLRVFNHFLEELAEQDYITIMNVKCQKLRAHSHIFALNCLLNRLERFLKSKDDAGIILMDSGHEVEYRKLYRKLHVINPVPSRRGAWEDGGTFKNMPLQQFIEDALFTASKNSLLLQAVDFVAFALNKSYTANERQRSFRLDQCFLKLKPILCLEASTRHPLGIVEL
jgi:hypothetical protein